MDIAIALILSAAMLLFVIFKGMFIGYMLIFSYICFFVVCLYREYSIKQIFQISWNSSKNSLIVIQIFMLIGAIIGIWFASGTIPTMVYYALSYLNPNIFLMLCFIICAATSFLIGTSFGTCSVMGVPLMIIARAGSASISMTAGSIICGAYFGDRMSFMSGSAILVSTVTKTEVRKSMQNMLKTAIVPTLLTLIYFYYLSRYSILNSIDSALQSEIAIQFNASLILLIPALVVLVMAIIGLGIKKAMICSIAVSALLTIFIQKHNIFETLRYIVMGFSLGDEASLSKVMRGGGIISMLKPALVIFVSTSLTGLLTRLQIMDGVKQKISKFNYKRHSLFLMTVLISTIASMVGCNQSISIIMTNDVMKDIYEKYVSLPSEALAIDMENSAVILAGMIPWSIAALVPATTLGVTPFEFMPYAFFVWILPIYYFASLFVKNKVNSN